MRFSSSYIENKSFMNHMTRSLIAIPKSQCLPNSLWKISYEISWWLFISTCFQCNPWEVNYEISYNIKKLAPKQHFDAD